MSIQYAGGTNVNATFTGAVKNDILANVEAQLITAGWSLVQGNVPTTVTVTIASPAVVSWTAHGLVNGTRIVFSTTGALPTGITAGTVYFVISAGLTANAFEFSTTLNGSAVNTSGSQSGTHTCAPEILMQSATTPQSVATRVRFRDVGSTAVCISFSIENSNSTLAGGNSVSNGSYLLPAAAKTFRIIANKYQCFIFSPITTPVRSFVAFGVPYLPSFLSGVITECGWMTNNAASDTDGTLRVGFRTRMQTEPGIVSVQGIVNSNLLDIAAQNAQTGRTYIVWSSFATASGSQTGVHWHDTSALMTEPLIAWATSSGTGEALIRGQLWDAVLIADTFAGDSTSTFDSHNWWAITDNNTTDKVTLFVVVP